MGGGVLCSCCKKIKRTKMKLAILVSLALCAVTQAHMGMTLAGVVPREKLKRGDSYRSPNSKVCHGTARIGVQKKLLLRVQQSTAK